MKFKLVAFAVIAAVTTSLAGCSATSGSSNSSSPAAAAAPAGSLAAVQKAGVLTVGTEGTYRPFSYHENGSGPITGYDVDVVKAVAAKLGVKAKFQETQWDAIFAGLEARRFDVIANQVAITPERKAKYLFSQPYTVSKGVIVTKASDSSITSFESLKGKTTAQSLTSNWYALAQKDGAKVQAVEGWAQAVSLVKSGRVDATINDQLTYLDYKKQTGAAGLKVAATTTDSSNTALAFRKGSGTLVAAANKALDALRADGTLTKLSQKYFGADVSE